MSLQQSRFSVAQGSLGDDPLASALAWVDRGYRVAIATVIDTRGSSPLPIGTQMAISEEGSIAGSVAGGCSELAVIDAARGVLASGVPRRLKLGSSGVDRPGIDRVESREVESRESAGDTAFPRLPWEIDLSCGGEIELFIELLQ